MTDPDALLADLDTLPSVLAVDRAAEVLAAAARAAGALADHDGYDTATLWWAAGRLTEAYTTLLPHTEDDPPSPPSGPDMLANDPDQLIYLLQATADALDRAARAAVEPSRIHALIHAADLAESGRRACINAKTAT
jgi:hypothetical protein